MQGIITDLTKHYSEQNGFHDQLSKKVLETKVRSLTQQNSELKSELNRMISTKIQPVVEAVTKAESTIQHLQGLAEMVATHSSGHTL